MHHLDHTPSDRLLCPVERIQKDKDGKVTTISGGIHYIIKSSYFISNAEDEKPVHLLSLILRNRKEDKVLSFSFCYVCQIALSGEAYYVYFCSYCPNYYHKECVESPSVFHSSDHPKHPLQLLWIPDMSLEEERDKRCCSCKRGVDALFYYCSICDFALHMACAGNPTSPTIDNPKRHKHTLHYFPRKSGLFCDVCALVDDSDYLYVCLLCDFIVHKRCVYLPYVIKVSRHNHRLTFTPNLPYEEPTVTDCGVCHAKINENYGEYSCTKKGCVYAVHSRCAMQSDVCDGKELEGEPEEVYEDTKMFEEKGDGIIQHQSHPRHQLRLEKIFHDESHHCQACRRPSYDHGGNVYRCMQCDDFIFHESCAYLPRTKQFMLHVHPLTLDPSYNFIDWFQCGKCYRYSCGFRYAYVRVPCDFFPVLDTLCASICEPFDHHSHPHSLFITSGEHESKICSICQSSEPQPLNCLKCDFCFVLLLCHSSS